MARCGLLQASRVRSSGLEDLCFTHVTVNVLKNHIMPFELAIRAVIIVDNGSASKCLRSWWTWTLLKIPGS